MRIAVVSDIHGNLSAFEAVLADLRKTSPDLVFHGGDLPYGGSSPAEIIDRIRDLGWPGVLGNTDEMLFDPNSLTAFAARSPHLQSMWTAIEEMAAATRESLGKERIEWLRELPGIQLHGSLSLIHASPETTWRAPAPEASDAEFESVYAPLDPTVVVYGHIHRSFARSVARMTVVNAGSVSLSYDGDPRAAYLLLDDSTPSIRRVDYDVDREIKALSACRLPHADWIARTLVSASPQMP
jgi:putative phosphoesterase